MDHHQTSAKPRGPARAGDTRLAAITPGLLGILCVIGAAVAFTTQDMMVKWLSGGYPLHQIVLVRASVALVILLAFVVPLEGGYGVLRTKRLGLHLARGFAVVVANLTFFTGLASLPLGEATAIFFAAPLFITILSIPMLGERVGPRRWAAVLIGLAGTAIMVRPGGATFQAAALLPLLAAFAYAMLQILTRKLGLAEKASAMAFYIQITMLVVATLFGLIAGDGRFAGSGGPNLQFLFRAWVWPDTTDLWIMAGIGCLSAAGGYLVSQAYRVAEAGLVAPFEYIAMPLAVVWGILLWGDWPDALAWTGIGLVAGAGVYVFYRETLRSRGSVSSVWPERR